MTKEERLKRYEQYQKENAKAESSSGFKQEDQPDIKSMVMTPGEFKLFRFVGNPFLGKNIGGNAKRTEAFDMYMFQNGQIIDDEGKWFKFIYNNDPEWPLRILMYKALGKFKWDKEANGGKGARVYENAGNPLLKRINVCGETDRFSIGSWPQNMIKANVIDYTDLWCKDNKKTKCIAWGEKESNGNIYTTWGMKTSFFQQIKGLSETWKLMPDEMCIGAMKYPKEIADKKNQNYFTGVVGFEDSQRENGTIQQVFDPSGDKNFLKEFIFNSGYDLSEDESNYEKHDLDDILWSTRPTRMSTIMKRIGKFIAEVDREFPSFRILEKCEEWKEKETEEWKASKGITNDETLNATPAKEATNEEAFVDQEATETPKKEEVAPRRQAVSEATISNETPSPEGKHCYDELSSDDKKSIIGFDVKSDSFLFPQNSELLPCTPPPGTHECGREFPGSMSKCPYCGQQYE